jgi:hypothetical protein
VPEEEKSASPPPQKKAKHVPTSAPNSPSPEVILPPSPWGLFAQSFLDKHYTGKHQATPYLTLCTWSCTDRTQRQASLMRLLFKAFLLAAQTQDGFLEEALLALCNQSVGIERQLNELINTEFRRYPPREQPFRDTLVINTKEDWLNGLALNAINKKIGKERKAGHEAQFQVAGCTHKIVQIKEGTTRIHLVLRQDYDPSYDCIQGVLTRLTHHLGGSRGIARHMLRLVRHPACFQANPFSAEPDVQLTARLYSQHGNPGTEAFRANGFLSCLLGLLLCVEPFYATVLYGSSLDMLELIEDGLMDFDDAFGHHDPWKGGLFPLYNTGEHEGSARLLADTSSLGAFPSGRDKLLSTLRRGFGAESCALYKAVFIQVLHKLAQEARVLR